MVVTEKSIVAEGVNKYCVEDMARVYGCGISYGEKYVFLQFPVQQNAKQAYRTESYTTAVRIGDEVRNGQAIRYQITLTYDGHVKEAYDIGLDEFGEPDTVTIE